MFQLKYKLLVSVLLTLFKAGSTCYPGEFECPEPGGRSKCLPMSSVCDQKNDCTYKDDEKTCDVIPEVTISCSGNYPKDGFYKGRSISCQCSTTYSSKKHRGTAQWWQKGQKFGEPEDKVSLKFNSSDLEEGFSCFGTSGYDKRGSGKTVARLRPKFAYLDADTVELSPTLITVCSSNSNRELTCKVPKTSANPPPLFSFLVDGQSLGEPQIGLETDTDFLQKVKLPGLPGVGTVDVKCHVTNPIFDVLKQEIVKTVTLRKPPTHPPTIRIFRQEFQGTTGLKVAVLPQNFSGVLTCNVSGGFPEASIATLNCGDNTGLSEGTSGIVRFQNFIVTQSMHGVICSCVAEHESGCYEDNETRVKIKVTGMSDSESDVTPGMSVIIAAVLGIIIIILIAVIIILVVKHKRHREAGYAPERVCLDAKA